MAKVDFYSEKTDAVNIFNEKESPIQRLSEQSYYKKVKCGKI